MVDAFREEAPEPLDCILLRSMVKVGTVLEGLCGPLAARGGDVQGTHSVLCNICNRCHGFPDSGGLQKQHMPRGTIKGTVSRQVVAETHSCADCTECDAIPESQDSGHVRGDADPIDVGAIQLKGRTEPPRCQQRGRVGSLSGSSHRAAVGQLELVTAKLNQCVFPRHDVIIPARHGLVSRSCKESVSSSLSLVRCFELTAREVASVKLSMPPGLDRWQPLHR